MTIDQLRQLWMQARQLRRQAEFALAAAQKAHDEAERAYNEAWAAEQAVRDELWDSSRGHWIKQEDRSEEEANDRADEYRMASKEGER